MKPRTPFLVNHARICPPAATKILCVLKAGASQQKKCSLQSRFSRKEKSRRVHCAHRVRAPTSQQQFSSPAPGLHPAAAGFPSTFPTSRPTAHFLPNANAMPCVQSRSSQSDATQAEQSTSSPRSSHPPRPSTTHRSVILPSGWQDLRAVEIRSENAVGIK